MRSGSLLAVAALVAAGCGSSHKAGTPFQVIPGDNVLAVSVASKDGCGGLTPYLNEPCVSVQVCAPGSRTNCQTIGGLLLDTGSYGLRVFKQVLSSSLLSALPAVQLPGLGSLAECVKFADLSADWGPVVKADVVLGNEPAVNVAIQVIDASFGTVPASCGTQTNPPESGPANFNGILGVGPFIEDCGAPCPATLDVYFASSGSTTTPVTLDASLQVQNPVALLPVDNNGIIIVLPGVPSGGAPTVTGSVVLGIGTRSNNVPTNASAIRLDGGGDFTTLLSGTTFPSSFADTGSNGLFFDAPSPITACTSQNAQGWYCPSSTLSFTATNQSSGTVANRLSTPFQVGNVESLTASGNGAFANVAGSGVGGGAFDWGLPFFFGRTVYLVIAGGHTDFGTGPILAY